MLYIKMEYRRTTLHPYDNDFYDNEDLYGHIETNSWAYPEERSSPFYVLWDEMKNLIWRCMNKQFKSQ